ncbi:hypothetical protein Dsin_012381 [Dipteronia sinensis]|uniref:No apical meristem-associated C-terminal domain-containing protein n=1 Tax=Dipteronia sinensis TaxID=43782 RepID=A0AAE0AHX0_9ROSI|nr:hypothetical protein Dsin_012381 [Dipteronia sinensis]
MYKTFSSSQTPSLLPITIIHSSHLNKFKTSAGNLGRASLGRPGPLAKQARPKPVSLAVQGGPPFGKYQKREAIRMYTDFTSKPFKFEHCWEILKNNPKWCPGELTKQCGSKKQKAVDGSFLDSPSPPTSTTQESFDTIDLESPVNEDTNSNGVVRP